MDIIAVMRLILIAPVATFIVISGMFYLLRYSFKLKTTFFDCMSLCVKWGLIITGVSLAVFILWMIWLSFTTNQDLGQAPLVWIFGIAPISFMVGFIIGFIVWCKVSLRNRSVELHS
jgi:hypothetical protein